MNIQEIRIEGLFGEANYSIRPKDNKLILVAENGSGKTTIVNIIYYFLSRQWEKLRLFKFEKITAVIDDKEIEIDRAELQTVTSEKIKRIIRGIPSPMREEILQEDFLELYRNPAKIDELITRYNLPRPMVRELYEEFAGRQATLFRPLLPDRQDALRKIFDSQILYLPTFRRIEQELGAIFPHIESDLHKYDRNIRLRTKSPSSAGFVELVEFGMEDVRRRIREKLDELDENLKNRITNNLTGGYLRDVINKTYAQISYDQIQAFSEEALASMLGRIDDSLLSKNEKTELTTFVADIKKQGRIEKEENKIIAYFIFKLSTIYDDLKSDERDIEQFISICNEYVGNKKFIYDNINFQMMIRPYSNGTISSEEIKLKDLSSGEKQIVSLFSHLFLSEHKQFYLVIDEPELSLSVPWQERFLVDVVDNPYCGGILAVTHSPFIFDNKLKEYAHGLQEFCY